MGFQRSTIKLKFVDEFEGLEISMKRPTIADCLLNDKLSNKSMSDQMDAMSELLASRIIKWNYENEDGTPIEPTVKNILEIDPEMFQSIIKEWFGAAISVSPPLPQPSENGKLSQELSIPMETL